MTVATQTEASRPAHRRAGRLPRAARAETGRTRLEVHLCVPDEDAPLLPDYMPLGAMRLPPGAPIPRVGEILYLSSTSAWCVETVVHEPLSPTSIRVEVWLTRVGAARCRRDERSGRTQ